MAKRVKSTSMTLKDFYEKVPGEAPLDTRLPSKPGFPKNGGYHDSTDVESVESRFSDMSLGTHGGYDSTNGSPFKGNGFPMHSTPYLPGPKGYERSIWLPHQPAPGMHDEYAGFGGKHSSSGSDTFSVGSGDMRSPSFLAFRQPPPPPPPRQPNVSGAPAHAPQEWTHQPDQSRGPRGGESVLLSDVREEDSFHYDMWQVAPRPAGKSAQLGQPPAPVQTWHAPATDGVAAPGAPQRPRLQLQPRSKPLPDANSGQPAEEVGGRRPRLQLQPRSKPLNDQQGRQSSIFGVARPREEILKDRGVDPVTVDLGVPAAPPQPSSLATVKAVTPPALRKIVPHQEESEWQTVGSRRSRQGDSLDLAYLAGENPLLSHTVRPVTRPPNLDGPYGGPFYLQGSRGGMYGAASSFQTDAEDDAVSGGFPGRRGLPTRRDDLF